MSDYSFNYFGYLRINLVRIVCALRKLDIKVYAI